MDIRSEVLGILVGGSPAPGINGVIAAVTLEAINQGLSVLGFYEGFKKMKQGISLCTPLTPADVTRIHTLGGSILRASRFQITNEKEVDNCLRVLEHHRVRYLVTIGGTDTAFSASLVAQAAKLANHELSIVHVPKTIFNDLPLPDGSRTFGFSTAREMGMQLVHNFSNDASTMQRWYILVVIGQKAGHLALGIGKAGAAALTLIPEDFKGKNVTFSSVCDILEGCIYKRKARGKEYGIAVIAEGVIDLMEKKEVSDRWGDNDAAHQELGRHIVVELQKRFSSRKVDCTLVARNIGNECRAADPNSDDIVLTRDLGFGAVHFLLEGGSGEMICMKGNDIVSIPFNDLLDSKTGATKVRPVDTRNIFYQVSQSYQFKLRKADLEDQSELEALAKAANMPTTEFVTRFEPVAEPSLRRFPSVLDISLRPTNAVNEAKDEKLIKRLGRAPSFNTPPGATAPASTTQLPPQPLPSAAVVQPTVSPLTATGA